MEVAPKDFDTAGVKTFGGATSTCLVLSLAVKLKAATIANDAVVIMRV